MRARTWTLTILAGAAVLPALASAVAQPPAQAPDPTPTPAPAAAAGGQPVAVVNGEPIAVADLEAVLQQQGLAQASLPPDQLREMRRLAVNGLVDSLLVQQYLRQNSSAPAPAQIDNQFATLEEGLKKQGKTLQDFYRVTGQTEAEFRTVVANLIRWGEYVKGHATEADFQRYHAENKDYFDGVLVRASHIVRRISANTTEADRQQVLEFLQTLRQYILEGHMDFAEAAKKYSECPTAPGGGDLGFFPRKFAVEEPFAQAAYALKVGEISQVVQTSYGMHLIKVAERKPGKPSDYAGVHDQVRDTYISHELRQKLIDQQRKTAKIEVLLP
jgi:peptidyl-prolyl cis-trans isomerase C